MSALLWLALGLFLISHFLHNIDSDIKYRQLLKELKKIQKE